MFSVKYIQCLFRIFKNFESSFFGPPEWLGSFISVVYFWFLHAVGPSPLRDCLKWPQTQFPVGCKAI